MKIRAHERPWIHDFVIWTGENYEELAEMCGEALEPWDTSVLRVKTPEGYKTIRPGAAVARLGAGDFLVVPAESFNTGYVVVRDEAE